MCKIKFGNGKEWHIAGRDGADTIALLSSSSFGYSPFSEVKEDNVYGNDQKGYKSRVKKYLENCETDIYFSSPELNLIKNTSVKTEDALGIKHTVTGRLYLPAAKDRYSYDGDTIYVGSNNDIPIVLRMVYAPSYWLRTPAREERGVLLTASGRSISQSQKDVGQNVKPAMNLDLSSVLFASSVPGTSSVTVTGGKHMTLRSGTPGQTDISNTGTMENVVYEAIEGYYFPEDYAAGITGPTNNIVVTRDSARQITISGNPKDDTIITLPDASAIELPDNNGTSDKVRPDSGTTDKTKPKLSVLDIKKPEFTNAIPPTGDDSNVLPFIILLAIFGVMAAVLIFRKSGRPGDGRAAGK